MTGNKTVKTDYTVVMVKTIKITKKQNECINQNGQNCQSETKWRLLSKR